MFLDQVLLIKDTERALSQKSKFRDIVRPFNGKVKNNLRYFIFSES